MRLIILATCLLMLQCTTTSDQDWPQLDACYCGQIGSDETLACAIWDRQPDLAEGQNVIRAEKGRCTTNVCKDLGAGICNKVVNWPHIQPKYSKLDIKDPCYCDEVVVTVDDEIYRVCAAWQKGDKHLIEYYSLDSCKPDSCGKSPFVKSATLCTLGFTSFYQPESGNP